MSVNLARDGSSSGKHLLPSSTTLPFHSRFSAATRGAGNHYERAPELKQNELKKSLRPTESSQTIDSSSALQMFETRGVDIDDFFCFDSENGKNSSAQSGKCGKEDVCSRSYVRT